MTMGVYFRCKSCGKEHRSPIAFGNRKSFETAELKGNSFQCPITSKSDIYNKADMFWKEE
jgi:hypothetical protein